MGIRSFLLGTAIGAEGMYWFDPDMGPRRRSLLTDKAISGYRRGIRYFDMAMRDLQHRIVGAGAEIRSALRGEQPTDRVLAERVRAKLGRFVSHPGAIQVQAHEGTVTVAGPILTHEVDRLLRAIHSVRGVRHVENQLEPHKTAGNLGALQGGRSRPGDQPDVWQSNWAPATRFVVGGLGTVMMLNCLAKRTPGAVLLGTVGFGLFMRAATNLESRRLLGLPDGARRRAIDLQKTIHIHAPVEQVFEFLSKPENIPRALHNVKQVIPLGENRYRWVVRGPAGAELHWDESITRYEENHVLSWRSEPDSIVGHGGIIHFEREDDNATRVHVMMSYSPPAGVLAHWGATMLGVDPKSQLDDAMVRIKSFLETGKQPHDAAQHVPPEEAARMTGKATE